MSPFVLCLIDKLKELPVLTIFDTSIGQHDLIDSANFAIMKRYVPMLLTGKTLPNPDLLSCKDHRVRTSINGISFGHIKFRV